MVKSRTIADIKHISTSLFHRKQFFAGVKEFHTNNHGQILTSVIVFMAFGLSVIALSAVLTIINIQNTAKTTQSVQALNYAEAGAEEAVLRLLRDPNYPGGTLTIDAVSVSINLTGDAVNKTIVSIASYNGFTKKIQATVSLANNRLTLVSWKQVL